MKSFLKKILPFTLKQKLLDVIHPDKLVNERVKFYSTFLTANDLVFDVGANLGNRVAAFLKIDAKVVAVEPQTNCHQYLKSKFGSKIFIVPKGLGAKEEVKNMFISDAHTLSSFSTDFIESMKASGRFSQHNWEKIQKIEITTLDNLIAQFGCPKFIKIDVEGYEEEVLKGLSTKVNYISIEYAVPEQLHKAIACLQSLIKRDPNLTCNYCIGESMEFKLDNWAPGKEFILFIQTPEFIESEFGDIYIKMA
jgi:FkbM family methyltransferase